MNSHRVVVETTASTLGPKLPLHRYSEYLSQRFGARTYRIAVDAGFSCPVRDAGEPCTYCDARGSRAPYLGSAGSIREQVTGAVAFVQRRYRAEKLLLYYQAYSGTHGPVDALRQVYDAGLACAEFEGLIVATRPDCIDMPRASLLSEYRARGLDVWVELGLQSAHDATLRHIRRGHTVSDFDRAVRLLQEHDILVAAHVILGLPGETGTEVTETARHLSNLRIDGVKFHNLTVVEGTQMYREYLSGDLRPPSASEYRDLLIVALQNLAPQAVVMRLTCDPPRGVSSVPADFPDKAGFYRDLVEEMSRRNTWQGQSLDNKLYDTVR